jgi:hypothetical protein
MGRIFIYAIMLYAIFLALYLLRERMIQRRKNAAKKTILNPFKSSPKEDIMGKSRFDPCLLLPNATTLTVSEKRAENDPIFADGNDKTVEQNAPAAIPPSELDRVFAPQSTDDNFTEYETDTPPPELEPENDEGEYEDEEEGDDVEGAAGVSLATALGFNDLAGMAKTVNEPEAATPQEKQEAGRVLVEVRKTDMFEQVVSGQPKKKTVVTGLMDDYMAAFIRRKREAGDPDEPGVKAPAEFDIRSFA